MPANAPLPVLNTVAPRLLRGPAYVRLLLRCMRPHQWVKNLFVLAPLLFGKRLSEPWAVSQALLAFAVFCLLASGLYVLNDVFDAEEDRAHPEKRRRPLASGQLPVSTALLGAGGLLAAAFGLATCVGLWFAVLATAYCLLTLAYCIRLKHTLILDAMAIAIGFVLRVIAGAEAVDVQPSHWLLICTFLLSLYLAFAKRRQELLTIAATAADHRRVLGEYKVGYLDQVNIMLAGAAIVCYALYTVAPDTVARFETDNLIFGTVFVIYGLLRYMALIQKPANGGDPSKVLLRDRPLLIATMGWAVYNGLVIYRAPLLALWGQGDHP